MRTQLVSQSLLKKAEAAFDDSSATARDLIGHHDAKLGHKLGAARALTTNGRGYLQVEAAKRAGEAHDAKMQAHDAKMAQNRGLQVAQPEQPRTRSRRRVA